jgi:hypothetical protein
MRTKQRRGPKRLNAFVILVGAAVVIAGLTSRLRIKFIGDLPVDEILFLPMMPILLLVQGRRQMVRPTMRPLLILLGVWLAGQMLTDVYRGTAFVDWARGDANIVFFGIDLLALIALLGRSESRKIIFLIGYSISQLLAMKYQSVGGQSSHGWKFGWGISVNILVVVCSCYFYRRRNYAVTFLLLMAIAAVNLIANDRSVVLFLFVTVALVVPVIPERVGRLRLLPPPGTLGRTFALTALALGAAAAALGAVKLATNSGLMGEEQQKKNEKQAQSSVGTLLAGRPEILVSSRAVIDSPILGHGSKAKDPKYIEMLTDLEARYGVSERSPDDIENRTEGRIPSHSFILGTWVEAGILGAIFWIYLLRPAPKALLRVPLLKPPLAPLYAYALCSLIWDIFFSPFAGGSRILAAFAIVIMADMLETQAPDLAIKPSRRARKRWRAPQSGLTAARIISTC